MGRSTTCWRCQLADLLDTLLAGPNGRVPDTVRPLADALLAAPRPSTGYAWIRRSPRAQQLLRDLAAGRLALTHDAFDALVPSPTVEHLRGLLVAQNCLPPRDINLAAFERWLGNKLASIDDLERRKLIDRFARWHLLRELRRRAAHGPLPIGALLNAKQSTTVAAQFLGWLADHGRTLPQATQRDIDAWFAAGPSTRTHVRRLLTWARERRILQPITIPPRRGPQTTPLNQRQRLTELHRLLDNDALPVANRLLAVLVVLLGQPVTKLVRLPSDAIRTDENQATITLGDAPIPLPAAVASVAITFLNDPRFRRNTAVNHDSPWLFPGTRPGQPLHLDSAYKMLHAIGISPRAARHGAWRALVHDAPPSVLATALGVRPATAMRHATAAGVDYTHYATSRS